MNIEINGKKPKLKMATIIAACTALDCKSAVDILSKIQSCATVHEVEGKKKALISDLVTYANIGETFLFHAMAGQCTKEEIEDYIVDFKVLNDVILWITDSLIGIMNPKELESPN